jgi:hypothetical protein
MLGAVAIVLGNSSFSPSRLYVDVCAYTGLMYGFC